MVSLLAACASQSAPSMYVHPNADLTLYPRVAVLPLTNLTTDRFAGDRVREILVVELAALDIFEVAENGSVNRTLRTLKVTDVEELDPPTIAAIGKELGVQGLFLGTVMDFRERRAGNLAAPEIALSLRLVDVESGVVVWAGNDARAGLSLGTRLFGVGEQTATSVVRELIRELMDGMLAEA